MVIYGDRGVGKTSFAWQVYDACKGEIALLSRYGQEALRPSQIIPCWVQVKHECRDLQQLLALCIREGEQGERTLRDAFPEVFDSDLEQAIDKAFTYAMSPDHQDVSGPDMPDSGEAMPVPTPSTLFLEVIRRASERHRQEQIVVFFDEFDLLENSAGMGKLIKTCSDARFVVIGIGESIDEIISDHPSADRKLTRSKFRVPPLSPSDTNEFYQLASKALEKRFSVPFKFTKPFAKVAHERSSGYPELVHWFGALAANLALANSKSNRVTVTKRHQAEAEVALFDDGESENIFSRARHAIAESETRFLILSEMAKLGPGWHELDDIQESLPSGNQEHFPGHVNVLDSRQLVELREATVPARIKWITPSLCVGVRIGIENGQIHAPKQQNST